MYTENDDVFSTVTPYKIHYFYYRVLYSVTVEPFYEAINVAFGGYILLNVLMYTVQILNIIWSYMIFRIIVVKFTQGSVSSLPPRFCHKPGKYGEICQTVHSYLLMEIPTEASLRRFF